MGKLKEYFSLRRVNRQAKKKRKQMLKQGSITQEQYDAAKDAKIQTHSDY